MERHHHGPAHGDRPHKRGGRERTLAEISVTVWLTEENADKPLLRSDMARIVRYIADWR